MTNSSLKTVTLDLPATTEDLRKLEIGTVVYLNGRVFTAREGVYKMAYEVRRSNQNGKEMLDTRAIVLESVMGDTL